MKKGIRIGALVIALFGALAIPAVSRAQLSVDEIAIALLGERFGIAPELIVAFLDRTDLDVFDAAPYYSVSYHTRRPVDEVWRLRRQGLGWGVIAQRLGMHPGTFNKLRKSGAFDRDDIWESICERRYGLRDADVIAIRRRGGTIRDVLPAVIIARASRNSPVTVYQRYQSVRDWNRTAGLFKTDLRGHRAIARQNAAPPRSRAVKAGHAPAKAIGKDRAHRTIRSAAPGRRTVKPVTKRVAPGQSAVKRRFKTDVQGRAGARGQGHVKGPGQGHGIGHSGGHGKSRGKGGN